MPASNVMEETGPGLNILLFYVVKPPAYELRSYIEQFNAGALQGPEDPRLTVVVRQLGTITIDSDMNELKKDLEMRVFGTKMDDQGSHIIGQIGETAVAIANLTVTDDDERPVFLSLPIPNFDTEA